MENISQLAIYLGESISNEPDKWLFHPYIYDLSNIDEKTLVGMYSNDNWKTVDVILEIELNEDDSFGNFRKFFIDKYQSVFFNKEEVYHLQEKYSEKKQYFNNKIKTLKEEIKNNILFKK